MEGLERGLGLVVSAEVLRPSTSLRMPDKIVWREPRSFDYGRTIIALRSG
jgi:hypothetical protein